MGQNTLPDVDAETLATTTAELNDSILQDALRERSESFVEYLQDEAAHKLQSPERGHMDAVLDALETIRRDGFYMDGENVTVFAHPKFVTEVERKSNHLAIRGDADSGGVQLEGARVYAAVELPPGRALAIHHDAIAPTPPGLWKPYLVEHPEGVVDMEVHE